MKKKIFSLLLIIFLLLIILFSASASSELQLPKGITKIKDYNKTFSESFKSNVSFIIAFIAGALSLISPCILPFLPAYFSYTFKEKKNITKMTLIFFLGFSLVFVTLGLIAGYIGETLVVVQENIQLFIFIVGLFLIMMGLMALFGKGFSSFIKVNRKFGNDGFGTFFFGIFFALGWSACLGPILSGILLIASTLGNFLYSGFLLFFYSLGLFVPLFVLSFFYDKYNLSQSRFIKGVEYSFSFGGKKIRIHSTNLISGLLFIVLGLLFIINRGTFVANKIDPFKTKQSFYDLNEKLIGSTFVNMTGVIILAIFLYFLYKFIKKK